MLYSIAFTDGHYIRGEFDDMATVNRVADLYATHDREKWREQPLGYVISELSSSEKSANCTPRCLCATCDVRGCCERGCRLL